MNADIIIGLRIGLIGLGVTFLALGLLSIMMKYLPSLFPVQKPKPARPNPFGEIFRRISDWKKWLLHWQSGFVCWKNVTPWITRTQIWENYWKFNKPSPHRGLLMTKKVTVIVEGREYIVEVGDLDSSPVTATVNKKAYQAEVPQKPAASQAKCTSTASPPPARSAPAPKQAAAAPPASGNAITAPMPGDILEVRVKPGDQVNPGDVVCVLEAMKMKNMIRSASGGKIATVEVSPGQAVEYNAILVTFE